LRREDAATIWILMARRNKLSNIRSSKEDIHIKIK
jgi:hypothetical protein